MTAAMTVLRAPSANRVYTDAAGPLAVAEATWVLRTHLGAGIEVQESTVGGMAALEISTGPDVRPQPDALLRLLGSLSATLGVLETVETLESSDGQEPLLRPLAPPPLLHHPADLETVLKYHGKTNEQFTALLVNLAAALSTRRARLFDGTLSLLDPMCGRGTTLNRALRLGLSPVGSDIDRKDIDSYRSFLSTWLRTHRYKHTLAATKLTVRGEHLGLRVDAELAADKQTRRAGRGQSVTAFACDTRELDGLLASRSVDAVVADLPYGIQHGSRHDSRWQRSPLTVLAEAAPGWRDLLRDGGGMALAVNRHTLDHGEATAALAAAGLRVISSDGAFRHRVDQSIDRDVLLAVPTDHPHADELAAVGAEQNRTRP